VAETLLRTTVVRFWASAGATESSHATAIIMMLIATRGDGRRPGRYSTMNFFLNEFSVSNEGIR
jgi:hypothetical protein